MITIIPRRPETQFALILAVLLGTTGLAGALGAVSALAGDTLRAVPALVVIPLYLIGWLIRSKRDESVVNALPVLFIAAWLTGLSIGAIAWWARVALLGA